MNFEERYATYKQMIDRRLCESLEGRTPRTLYEPAEHVLNAGGKRIRGVLVMLAADAVGGDGAEALDAGAAVEMLHNFTLVHDDIMDRAATRRGHPTIHTRWDEGTAILVGDVMIGVAQQMLLARPMARSLAIFDAFTRGLVDVCEGQMLDKEFETRSDLTLDDYMHMIAMKTGRLAEMAAEVGGLVADANPEAIEGLCAYARHLGRAFQIQDDLLDIVADEAELGKRIGGDVIEGKRTYLLLQAMGCELNDADRSLLQRFLDSKGLPEEHIDSMRGLYQRNGIIDRARRTIEETIAAAQKDLEVLPATPGREMLVWFADMVMQRKG